MGAILAPAGRSLRAQLRYANSLSIPYALILGEDEMKRRIALVIGNSSYENSPLHNPVNDAEDMSAALNMLCI